MRHKPIPVISPDPRLPNYIEKTWSLEYTNGLAIVPDEQRLLNRIICAGDSICLPAKNQSFYKFTLDGTFLGTYPNTPEIDDILNPKINCSGKLFVTPFSISGITIEKAVFLDS